MGNTSGNDQQERRALQRQLDDIGARLYADTQRANSDLEAGNLTDREWAETLRKITAEWARQRRIILAALEANAGNGNAGNGYGA